MSTSLEKDKKLKDMIQMLVPEHYEDSGSGEEESDEDEQENDETVNEDDIELD